MEQEKNVYSLKDELRTDSIVQIFDFSRRSMNILMFARAYRQMPMVVEFENVPAKDIFEIVRDHFHVSDENMLYTKKYNASDKEMKTEDWLLQTGKQIWLAGYEKNVILLSSSSTDSNSFEATLSFLQNLANEMQYGNEKMYLISSMFTGLDLDLFKLNSKPVDIATHYNDDFEPVSRHIVHRLSDTDSGIVLLHGLPGTGKTTYIRYLLKQLKKKIIYLPVDLVYSIAGPRFTSLLAEHPHSVLVVEDAENVIAEREQEALASMANLLNLSDGLLGDCLSIQIICTFNCHISKIDKALLRKGRLIAQYYFDKLTPEKSSKLLHQLGHEVNVYEPMTLAEIYNFNEMNFSNSQPERKAIGFAKQSDSFN